MIVLDTGPLVALVDTDDDAHERTRTWFRSASNEPMVIPAPILGEAWYLVARGCGAEVESRFLMDLARGAYAR